jgi:CheY-like chemotaxis protein
MTDVSHERHALAVVAEDVPLVRMEMADMLRDAGFEVDEVNDAAGALAYLEQRGGVTLLFTDIRMPGEMDGVGLAHEVARRWPGTRIIICSGAKRPAPAEIPAGALFFENSFAPSQIRAAVNDLTPDA